MSNFGSLGCAGIPAAARAACLSENSLWSRIRSDPAFREQVDREKGPLQARAEEELIRRALGTPERAAEFDGDGNLLKPYQPAQPGDPKLLIYFMRNRYPGQWHEARLRR